jgi:uncharacterized protein with PQ loop repeat
VQPVPVLPPLLGPDAVRFLSVFAPVTGPFLWFAPYPTLRDVAKRGTTAGLPPLNYFCMMVTGVVWTAYGILASMDYTIIIPNLCFGLCGAFYTAIFLRHDSGQYPTKDYLNFSFAIMFSVVAIMLAPPTVVSRARVQAALGWGGSGVVVALFAGPLQVMGDVVTTGSTRDLPLPMALASLLSTILWTAYGGLVVRDRFVWVPNALGLVCSAAQLALLAVYGCDKGAAKEEEEEFLQEDVLDDVIDDISMAGVTSSRIDDHVLELLSPRSIAPASPLLSPRSPERARTPPELAPASSSLAV